MVTNDYVSRPVVLLVHGTFARNAPWTQPESLLRKALSTGLNDPEIRTVEWSGKNTFQARIEAGDAIAACLQCINPRAPIAIVCHSHGGSAVAYGLRRHPSAFRDVKAVVCLATPFFGFSVRPGYQALLSAVQGAAFFLVFQFLLLFLTASLTEYFPQFTDQVYGLVAIGLTLLLAATATAVALWSRRFQWFQSFEGAVTRAAGWDTTQVSLPNPLFVRSMGDEVGLSLSTLQFWATALNKALNLLSSMLSRLVIGIRKTAARPRGALALLILAGALVVASGLPAAMAATFGYSPRHWIDLLYPWSASFNIIDPQFGLADQVARLVYALALSTVTLAYVFMLLIALTVLAAVLLSWITTAAFGCFSLRLAIATEWAVEPTPEGLHAFLNGGWSRNIANLRTGRSTLQHSEPYSSSSVLDHVVSHMAANLWPRIPPTDVIEV